jgi:hypothetical protein
VMEQRGIGERIGSGRILQNWSVQKVTPRLQVETPIIRHGVECRKVKKSEEDSENGMKYVWNDLKPEGYL